MTSDWLDACDPVPARRELQKPFQLPIGRGSHKTMHMLKERERQLLFTKLKDALSVDFAALARKRKGR